MCQQSRFSHVLGILNFSAKLIILQRLQPLLSGHFFQFSKWPHFSILSCFLEPSFAYNNSNVLVESFFPCFRHFQFFSQTDHFAEAIAIAQWPFFSNFQNGLISPFLAVFWSHLLHRTTIMCQLGRFSHVLDIFNFSAKPTILQRLQALLSGHFFQFSKWPHFSILSCFLEKCFEQNNCNVLVESFFACFRHFEFFTQTDHFGRAIYSLCLVAVFANFENGVISPI